VLTAWALAGVAGPQIASFILETTGSYTQALYIMNGALVVGLLTVLVLNRQITTLQGESDAQVGSPSATVDD
jgi:OFA family oxalate/formate antiporter-like MFS transporter